MTGYRSAVVPVRYEHWYDHDQIAGSLPAELVAARSVGQLCGTSATDDITDASVAFTARQLGLPGHHSDPDDIRRIDNRLDVVPI